MNVILIAIDTLRADHLGCYGYNRPTSPHLDRLAGQGVAFTEAFSPHIPTHPSFTTVFTGVDVMTHNISCQGGKVELDPGLPTLPEVLRAHGYYTASVDNLGRWFTRGFEKLHTYRWERDWSQPWRKAEAVDAAARPALAEAAAQDRPFFMFVHYWDPHTPYLPPPPFDRMFYGGDERDPDNQSMDPVWAFEPFRDYFAQWMAGTTDIRFPVAQYDAEIAYVDVALARFLNRLDELGLAEETLVVVYSDHGEVLDDHEGWFDHHGLYDANVRIPLIMRCPGRIPAGLRLGGFVRTLDLAPTILDFLGLADAPEAARLEGASALPLIREGSGRGLADELYLTESTWMRKRGIRTHEWKLIAALEPDFHGMPATQLFHLSSDPGEQRNLAEERPEVVEGLRARLADWVRRRLAATGLPDPLETQDITLRRIGGQPTGRPRD